MEEEKEAESKSQKNKKIIIIIAVCVVFIICAIIGAVFGGGADEKNDDNNNNDNDIETPSDQVEIYRHELGEMVEYANLNITAKSYEFKKSFAGVSPDANTDNTLLIVNMTIYNPTNSTINLYNTIFTYRDYLCEYNIVYNATINYGSMWSDRYSDFLNTHDSIKPLSSISASLCFQVPSVVQSQGKIELKLYDGKTACKLFHYWELRVE